jgi:hypothetical protein
MLTPQTETTSTRPFLLHFLEPVQPMAAPEHNYDPATQTGNLPVLSCGTHRTQSFSNRTSGYGLITGYEDADDQQVTVSD